MRKEEEGRSKKKEERRRKNVMRKEERRRRKEGEGRKKVNCNDANSEKSHEIIKWVHEYGV